MGLKGGKRERKGFMTSGLEFKIFIESFEKAFEVF
jgi:hypothetical protein